MAHSLGLGLLLLGLVVMLSPDGSEAKGLRMRVIGGGGKSRGGGGKPWDRGRHNPSLFEQRYEEEYDDYSEFTLSGDRRPCVGLCYYLKVLEAERKKNEPVTEKVREEEEQGRRRNSYDDDDYSGSGQAEPEVTTKKFVNPIIKFYGPTKKPCVGLCYHYKRLGLPNPYEVKEEEKEEEKAEIKHEDGSGERNEGDDKDN